MKRGVKSSVPTAGFTIVETMIVLAVTGLLFVAIGTTWFGRQHKTEFQTSAQEMRSRIQQVISDVQNGYFPNQNNFSCTAGPTFSTASPGPQGTNQPCVFLGKVIQFHMANTDPEQFRVYTVAADGSKTDIQASKPTVIAPANGVDLPDNWQSGTLNSGLSWRAYKITTSSTTVLHRISEPADIAIGFLSTLGSLDKNNAYNSGTQQVNLYALPEVAVPSTSTYDAANAINNLLQSSPSGYFVNSQTALCFQSGATNQYAVITLGENSSPLTPDLSIEQGTCDANFL